MTNTTYNLANTFIPSKPSIKSQWYLIDATDKCLGRLATEVVQILRGKDKTYFTPSHDTGDYVVIINANKIKVSGKKETQKVYFRHSGFLGGQTTESFSDLQKRLPERILEKAVKGMLPKNRLGRKLFTKLKVYSGGAYPHTAQKPQIITLEK